MAYLIYLSHECMLILSKSDMFTKTKYEYVYNSLTICYTFG